MIRSLHRLPITLVLLEILGGAAAGGAEVYLPAIGGSGGGQFLAPCPDGQNLTGFELRAGNDIDVARLLCITAYSSGSVNAVLTGSSFVYVQGAD